MPSKGRKKGKKRKHPAAPAPAPPAGEPLEQLQPGTRVAARDDSAAVWLATFDGWVCEDRRYARTTTVLACMSFCWLSFSSVIHRETRWR